ncbi:MAG: hypothetical protein B7X99_20810 [Rhizobiales bacterium 17-65-6]|nr:MAG: hypothetical protein B7X99_20810 [Rhizobiales bacterium 17-65-6]
MHADGAGGWSAAAFPKGGSALKTGFRLSPDRAVPVHPLTLTDPIAAFAPFADEPVAALLLSGARDGARGRYSYLAVDPLHVVTTRGQDTFVDGSRVDGDPFSILAREIAALPRPQEDWPVPFRSGAVGYLGYELGGHLERLPAPRPDAARVPDMVAGLYDSIIAFDHETNASWLLSTADEARRSAILDRLARAPVKAPVPNGNLTARWTAEQDRAAREAAIARAIAYIHAGDIFQANITHRLRTQRPAGLNDLDLFQRLTAQSPAPFAALLACGQDAAVVSASPERFLRLTPDGRVETRPIKGTRPRGATADDDASLSAELAVSLKDRAENLMIVDLMRNDLARVCAPGSVKVPELFAVESFVNVHHLVSTVSGRLAAGRTAIDLLKAAFPPGSITGAPKVQAMKLISQLESPRGPYCGSLFWAGADGAFDSSVLIRTAACVQDGQGWAIEARAGAGIVADSEPRAERIETQDKIAALARAMEAGA